MNYSILHDVFMTFMYILFNFPCKIKQKRLDSFQRVRVRPMEFEQKLSHTAMSDENRTFNLDTYQIGCVMKFEFQTHSVIKFPHFRTFPFACCFQGNYRYIRFD